MEVRVALTGKRKQKRERRRQSRGRRGEAFGGECEELRGGGGGVGGVRARGPARFSISGGNLRLTIPDAGSKD